MATNLDAQCKQCRRAGEKLFLKGERCSSPKCALVKRNTAPGFHGAASKGRRRVSDYGQQLAEKQKVRRYYNLMEKQFRITFERAKKKSGDAGKNFLKMLEMRLDNTVFRLGFAVSRFEARQVVGHGHLLVNGKKVDIPSYQVKEGDVISIRERSLKNAFFKKALERKVDERPSWLSWNNAEKKAKVLHEPADTDLPANFNVQVIIEYYSK
ncbi:30S ribosomal protein S4 [Candidatus Falkowbacteria bacterium]|jgi:small subunit ribosomal protein S4|nr:30S ribosomal protein S4 [Patescibacteria group bacterium]MDD3434932.1 30S ribosomal protein S4 [Patescibacteria group bacterium]MDD4466379.1 30S ribosomal protein S4 [Patescibacteria group bacterium]NCU43097.1 30S ribosomal protein S4 [Candidatus Falkowbacteria bacterium]